MSAGTGQTMARPDDLISVLQDDHRELRQLLTEVEHLCGGESLRRSLTEQMIIEMVRHMVAEEAYLYPVCRAHLPDGGRITDEADHDHERIEKILKRLEDGNLSDEEFSHLLSSLTTISREHMEDEEWRVFPLLKKYVSREELLDLGEKAMKAKASAPSRPEPWTPSDADAPLLQMLLRTGSGLVERARDYLCGRGKAYPDTR